MDDQNVLTSINARAQDEPKIHDIKSIIKGLTR